MIAAIVVLAALAAGLIGFILGHVVGYGRATVDAKTDAAAVDKITATRGARKIVDDVASWADKRAAGGGEFPSVDEIYQEYRQRHAAAVAASNVCHDSRCHAAGKHACHNLDCKQHGK